MPQIPFASQSYRHDSAPISSQRVLNMYAERQPQDAKSPVTVHGCPGITTFATCGTGPVRGFKMLGGLLYAVSGGNLYSVTNDPTPVATSLGGTITGSGVVSIDDNGDQILIVNGANGYVYTTAAGFVLVTDTDFNAAKTAAYLNGRFYLDNDGTNQIFASDSLDGTSYNALAFASKESKSDFLQAVVNVKQVMHLLGQSSSELWADQGAANFPLQPLSGGTIERGVISAYATAQEDQALFLVGDDRVGYRVNGTQLGRISTHAIEQAWQRYTAVSDVFGLAYTWNGHKFVCFTAPTEEVSLGDTTSWVYDISSGLWHERLSYDLNGTPLGRWRGNCAIAAYGKILIGDAFSGKVGYLDPTVNTEFGCPMYASVTSPPYHAGDKRLFSSKLTIDVESGVGITPGEVGVEGNDTYTKVLLAFDGADASTTFTDTNAGGSSHTWTANGNAQVDTAQSRVGGASGLFDGTGDYITTPDHADFTLGSGDFTVDCWFQCNAASGGSEILKVVGQAPSGLANADRSFRIARETTNVMSGAVFIGGTQHTLSGTTQFTSAVNTGWHHVAFVRTGDTLRLFIDGVQEGGDLTISGSVNDSAFALSVGRDGEQNAGYWQGWIDELRLSVGVARWTTTFTPPAGPYQTLAQIAANSVGVDPQIMLDISDDGGTEWSHQMPWASMGVLGARKTRVKWDRLGSTEPGGTRVYRLTITDPVKRTIVAAHADMRAGM